MEKYPHRMNFAKGILESRKQTYKHLKSVLRPLPLQTATEIELSPKQKIQVTLFDANHCPGAVSFLIEGNGHAILYTGDVRAEQWWVNSIIQNPRLLPYACGLKVLDCIYLDTTFASHDDVYKDFPTKAAGLQELMEKVAQLPSDTVCYFRGWTLGYEHVWMTLSNILGSQVHVDDYQLRLFGGIVENGRDGFSMFEGPALIGNEVGNGTQNGCLTDSSDVMLHSCEPGTACHADLKKRNVVWITPIISRLKDGTELLEIGAGGGLGDLYQTPELEVGDIAILQGLTALCGELKIEDSAVKNLLDSIDAAQKLGSTTLSLDGLGFDAEAETSLKEFISVLAGHDDPIKTKREKCSAKVMESPTADRVIHFPYSRHSSLSELRHLVSVFRPKDICPCTVELASWSEDVSMSSLFGDLCSEQIFVHDNETRRELNFMQNQQEARGTKRKRDDDSQETQACSEPVSQDEHFVSARDCPPSVSTGHNVTISEAKVSSRQAEDSVITQRPLVVGITTDSSAPIASPAGRHRAHVDMVKEEFRRLNDGSDFITIEDDLTDHEEEENGPVRDHTQASMTSSTFDSQSQAKISDQAGGTAGATVPKRTNRRRSAYDAAVRSLKHNDSSDWEDLTARSFGRRGHTEEETEL